MPTGHEPSTELKKKLSAPYLTGGVTAPDLAGDLTAPDLTAQAHSRDTLEVFVKTPFFLSFSWIDHPLELFGRQRMKIIDFFNWYLGIFYLNITEQRDRVSLQV